MKRAGKRLRSTKQPLCDSFSSGNVGKGVFGASRFAFLNRGRLAPKQSKNTSGARPERRCGLRECDLGRGATQMPVRNERAQAQGTITVDPLLASPPPPKSPLPARAARPIGFPARQARGVGARAKGAHRACLTGNVAAADPGALHNRPPLRPGAPHPRRARIEPTARPPEPTRVPTTPR